MTTVTTVTAKFQADASDLVNKSKQVERSLKGVQNQTQGAAKNFTIMENAIGTALGGAAIAVFAKGALMLKKFTTEAVAMARESELTVNRLNAVASTMGVLDTVLGGSTVRLTDFAQSLQETTGVSDEVVKSGQAILLTFKDVASTAGTAGDTFDRATTLALDLAAVGFGSVESNAKSLGRALQDPLKGLTMLGRQGVTFTLQEQEKIKTLVESNRLMDAQAIILAAVENQVGGTAAATATSAAKMSAAFKDVQENIGLGLLPVIDAVADSMLNKMQPTLMQMSEQFRDVFGPQLAERVGEILPPLLELGQSFLRIASSLASLLAPVLAVTEYNLRFVAAAAGALAKVINAVPGPVLAAVAALLLLRTAIMKSLIAAMAAAAAAVGAAALRMFDAFLGLQLRASAALTSMRTQMAATEGAFRKMGVVAKTMALGVVGAIRTIGGAIKGLMASLGPVGIALIGLSIAFEVVAGSNAEAERKAAEYKDTLTELTGAATEATTELVALSLATQTTGFWFFAQSVEDLGKSIGLSLEDMTRAVLMTEAEYSAFIDTLNLTPEAPAAADLVVDALNRERAAIQLTRTELDSKNRSMQVANSIAGLYDDAHSRAAVAAGQVGRAAATAGDAIAGMGDEANDASEDILEVASAVDLMMASLGRIDAVDAARQSLNNIGTSAVDNGTKLMALGDKSTQFRSDVGRAFADAGKAAQILGDTAEEQQIIFAGEMVKIVASLRASGVKDKDIEEYLGTMKDLPADVKSIMGAAAEAVGETDFRTQIEKAFDKSVKDGTPMTADAMSRLAESASKSASDKLGLTMEPQLRAIVTSTARNLVPVALQEGKAPGFNMSSGIAAGINLGSPLVQAAVRRVITAAKAAADAAAESASPSRLFARTGDDIVAGVAMGVTRSTRKATNAMRSLVRDMVRAFRSELADLSVGPVQSAFERVFGSRAEIRDSSRALQDASWALADARDAVVQAEKALSEARKEGNAREVAAAERDLARARRDAADAADAEKAAKFVAENQKALLALQKITRQYDYITAALERASEVFTGLAELTAKPFGVSSDLQNMFGSSASIDSVARSYVNLRDQVRDAFAVLTDPKIVGRKAARKNRREMNRNLRALEALAQEAIGVRRQYEANLEEIAQLESDYQDQVKGINDRYDALDAAGKDNLAGLESRLKDVNSAYESENRVLQGLIGARDQFLNSLADSTRKFVNNMSFPAPTTRIVREARRLANGIMVTIDREISEGGNAQGIRASLEERLDQVRAFSRNIASLVARGLDPTLVQDFVSAGVSGAGDAVAELAKASDSELSAINDVQSALGREIAQFGAYAEGQWFAAGIAQQEAIVAPLEVQRAALEDAVSDARAYLEELARLRESALQDARVAFESEKARLEAENVGLLQRMDEIANEIDAMIVDLMSRLPQQSIDAGQKAVNALLRGFRKDFPKVAKQLGGLMDELVKSMRRTATITIRAVMEAGTPLPGRAMGGPVRARQAYVVGERGPELFMSSMGGNIIANHRMGSIPQMGSQAATGATVNTYQITVNAGVGDPREIGRVTVDAIKAYERSSGKVFVSAA